MADMGALRRYADGAGARGLLGRANANQLLSLSQLYRTDAYRTNPSTNSEFPVPSACPWKGKRRKNIDSPTSLRYNGEPHHLPSGKAWAKGEGTWSTCCMRV